MPIRYVQSLSVGNRPRPFFSKVQRTSQYVRTAFDRMNRSMDRIERAIRLFPRDCVGHDISRDKSKRALYEVSPLFLILRRNRSLGIEPYGVTPVYYNTTRVTGGVIISVPRYRRDEEGGR